MTNKESRNLALVTGDLAPSQNPERQVVDKFETSSNTHVSLVEVNKTLVTFILVTSGDMFVRLVQLYEAKTSQKHPIPLCARGSFQNLAPVTARPS